MDFSSSVILSQLFWNTGTMLENICSSGGRNRLGSMKNVSSCCKRKAFCLSVDSRKIAYMDRLLKVLRIL